MKFNCYDPAVAKSLSKYKESLGFREPLISVLDRTYQESFGHGYLQSMDAHVAAVESAYIASGQNCVFITNDVANMLYNMKFDAGMMENIPMPLETFSIATESNLKIDGVEILPFLTFSGEDMPLGCSVMGKNIGLDFDMKQSDDVMISVYTHDSLGKDASIMNLAVSAENASSILAAKGIDDLSGVVGKNKNSVSLNPYEDKRLIISLKLAIAMCVYNHITDGKFLISGFPIMNGQKPNGKKLGIAKNDINTHTGRMFRPDKETMTRSNGVRGFHFRNLMHPKYYKGEHSSKPIGSRWVEVSAALVGGGTPHNQLVD